MTKEGLSKERETKLLHAIKLIIKNDDFFTHVSKTQPPHSIYDAKQLRESMKYLRPYHSAVWGPAGWTFLQGCMLGLPCSLTEQQFLQFRIFLALLATFLPCPDCRKHFSNAIRTMPRTKSMRSRVGLLAWLVETHSKVRAHQGKQVHSVSKVLSVLKQKENAPQSSNALHSDPDPGTVGNNLMYRSKSTQYTFSLFWLVLIAGAFILVGFTLGQMGSQRKMNKK